MRRTFRATSAANAVKSVPAVHTAQISRRALIFGLGGITVAGSVGLGKDIIPISSAPAEIKNPKTGCTSISPASTAILFDLSDEYSRVHTARAIRTVEDEALKIQEGGKIIILSMSHNSPDSFENHFMKCSPGYQENSSWTQGSEYNRRRFQSDFLLPLREQVEKLIATASPSVSPIIETTAALTRDPIFDASIQNRRLVWVTDGLQNDHLPVPSRRKKIKIDISGKFTLYTDEDVESLFRRSRLSRQLRADLSGVSVSIAYLVRPEVQRYQTPAARTWLARRFREAGAGDVRFTGIPA